MVKMAAPKYNIGDKIWAIGDEQRDNLKDRSMSLMKNTLQVKCTVIKGPLEVLKISMESGKEQELLIKYTTAFGEYNECNSHASLNDVLKAVENKNNKTPFLDESPVGLGFIASETV